MAPLRSRVPAPTSAAVLALTAALSLYAALISVVAVTAYFGDGGGRDQAERWQEVHYFVRGIDPAWIDGELKRLRAASRAARLTDPTVPMATVFEMPSYQEDLYLPFKHYPVAVYPPWTYPLVTPLHFWTQPLAKPAYAVLAVLAYLGCIAAAAASVRQADAGSESPPRSNSSGSSLPSVSSAWLAGASVAAMSSFSRTLEVGNYGSIVLAALWGSLLLLMRGHVVAAGALLGFACLKPTIALPFLLVPLLRRAWWRALGGASAVLLGATLVAWLVHGNAPWSSLLAAQAHVPEFVSEAGGLPGLVAERSSARTGAASQRLLAGVVGASGALVLFLCRRRSAHVLYAIAATIALLWTYHRQYDHVVLSFVLVASAIALDRTLRTAGAAVRAVALSVYTLVGITLWLPGHWLGLPATSAYWAVLWGGALALAAAIERTRFGVARTADTI